MFNEPEGGVSVKALGEKVSRGFEFVPDESESYQPSPHGESGILGLHSSRERGLLCFRGLAECQAKLNVAFQLSGVKPALAGFGGVVELEKSELNRALGEGRVEVEHMVAAAVVVCAPEIVAEGRVPNLRKLAHRGGLCSVQLSQEGGVDRFAVTAEAVGVNVDRPCEEVLVACHDVGEVSQALRCVSVRSDVDVNSAAEAGVALGACLS